jgi:hypothetical protein
MAGLLHSNAQLELFFFCFVFHCPYRHKFRLVVSANVVDLLNNVSLLVMQVHSI